MTPEEKRIVNLTIQWIRTKMLFEDKVKKHLEGVSIDDILPTLADVDHSALLRRLLEDKKPLEIPPPRAYSYPWYDLVEDGEAALYDLDVYLHSTENYINICQSIWIIKEQVNDSEFIVENAAYGHIFKLSPGPSPLSTRVNKDGSIEKFSKPGWKLERYESIRNSKEI